jgi:hypothetical protein
MKSGIRGLVILWFILFGLCGFAYEIKSLGKPVAVSPQVSFNIVFTSFHCPDKRKLSLDIDKLAQSLKQTRPFNEFILLEKASEIGSSSLTGFTSMIRFWEITLSKDEERKFLRGLKEIINWWLLTIRDL